MIKLIKYVYNFKTLSYLNFIFQLDYFWYKIKIYYVSYIFDIMSDHPVLNPFSTGGGGTNFEQKVATFYMVHLLSNKIPPGLIDLIKKIKYQQIHRPIDDLVITYVENNSNKTLSLQMKHRIKFTKSNNDFNDIIKKCWEIFCKDLNQDCEKFGIGIGVFDSKISLYNEMQNIANNSSDETDFMTKQNLLSKPKRELFNLIKNKITQHKGKEPSNYEMWKFIKHFVIIHFDFEHESSKDVTYSINLLKDILRDNDIFTAKLLLSHLFSIAVEYNTTMGTIDYNSLLRKCENFDIKQNLDPNIIHLDNQTKSSLDSIKDTIDNDIKLPRTDKLNKIHKVIADNDFIILKGESLTGKSVLLKMLAKEYTREGKCIFFKTNKLEQNSLQSYLHQLNINIDFQKLLTYFEDIDKKCIFIDGLEYVEDLGKKNIIFELICAVVDYNQNSQSNEGKKSCWKIICSSRIDQDKSIINSDNTSIPKFVDISINGLNNNEKNMIISKNPHLKYLTNKTNLQELFSRPGIINLIMRQKFPHDEKTLQQITSESQFMKIFWDNVICYNKSNIRSESLSREQLIMKIAKSLLLNGKQNYLDIDNVAVLDDLITDDILSKDGNNIRFVHDYVEDWSYAFLLHDDFNDLYENIQNSSKPLRRLTSFRLLSQYLLDVDKNYDAWKNNLKQLQKKSEYVRWESEWLLAPALSPTFESTLLLLIPDLIKNENNILNKLLNAMIRTHDQYANKTLMNKLPKNIIDRIVIDNNFNDLAENTDQINYSILLLLKSILNDNDIPPESIADEFFIVVRKWLSFDHKYIDFKKILAIKCIKMSEYYLKLDNEKLKNVQENLIRSILKSSDVIPDMVIKFLEYHILIQHMNRYDVINILMREYNWSSVCKNIPKTFSDISAKILCHSLSPYQDHSTDYGVRSITDHDSFNTIMLFWSLLDSDSDEGLKLIHKITNHSTLAWRISNKTQKPIMHPLKINDKTLNLWGDDLVYRWYRPPGMGSHTVSHALLALELWLDTSIKNGADIKQLLENVLMQTISVSIVGVISSIILRHYTKSVIPIAIAILKNPVFWLMEHRRYIHDEHDAKYNCELYYMNDKFTHNFIKQINNQKQRKIKFDHILPSILLSEHIELKTELVNNIKNFPNMDPKYYEFVPSSVMSFYPDSNPENVKRMCNIWSYQADINNYDKRKIKNGFSYVFDTQKYLSPEDLFNIEQYGKHTKLLSYTIWASNILHDKSSTIKLTVNDAIEYAKNIENDDTINMWDKLNFMVNLSAVLIIKEWNLIDDDLRTKCVSVIIDATKVKIDENPNRISDMHYDMAVACALPYIYKYTKKRICKKLLKSFSKYPVHEVRNVFYKNMQILWEIDPKIIWLCIKTTKKLSIERMHNHSNCPFLYGISKRINQFPIEKEYINPDILLSIISVIPTTKHTVKLDDNKLIELLDELLDFIMNEYVTSKKENSYYEHYYSNYNNNFFNILSYYMSFKKNLNMDFRRKIFLKWCKSPSIMNDFLRQFLLVNLNDSSGELNYNMWKSYCDEIMETDDVDKILYVHENIVGLLIFVDPIMLDHMKIDPNIWLIRHIPIIEKWCIKFGTNSKYFSNIIIMLKKVDLKLINDYWIEWLFNILKHVKNHDLFFKHSNIIHNFDLLLRSTWDKFNVDIKQNNSKFHQFTYLVDTLANQNAPYSNHLQKILENESSYRQNE